MNEVSLFVDLKLDYFQLGWKKRIDTTKWKDNKIDGQNIGKITRQLEIKMGRWKDSQIERYRWIEDWKDNQRARGKDGKMEGQLDRKIQMDRRSER